MMCSYNSGSPVQGFDKLEVDILYKLVEEELWYMANTIIIINTITTTLQTEVS